MFLSERAVMADNFESMYLVNTPSGKRTGSEPRHSLISLDLNHPDLEADYFLEQLHRRSIDIDSEEMIETFGNMNATNDGKGNGSAFTPDKQYHKHSSHSGNQTNSMLSRYDKSITMDAHSLMSQSNDSNHIAFKQHNNNYMSGMQSERNPTFNLNDTNKSDQHVNCSSELNNNKREIKTNSPPLQSSKVNDVEPGSEVNVSLQEKYSNAIEEFRQFRAKLALNMDRNLMRTEQFNMQNKLGSRYRSQEDLSRSAYDIPSRTLGEMNYRNMSRYASQEQLHRRQNELVDERQNADYFSASSNQSKLANNNHIDVLGKPIQVKSYDYPLNPHELREHQVHLRDQAARSNFERYLRGSGIRHQATLDSFQERDNSIYEEQLDIGYGGSGSTTPKVSGSAVMSTDQLSSRSGSVNSRHSQASSVLTSVDSGVRMSFVGQHNSLVVVAIDFGTTFSGYAFSFTRDSTSIHMMRRWEGGDPGVTNQKTPTTILLKPDGSFHSFGFGARDFYHDLDTGEAKKWLYFDKFKMSLHSNKDLHAGYEIKAANGKLFPALKVFSSALKFFRDHVLAELSDQSTAKLTEEDITWVLTVPAIWRQPAKQFMRTAAYEAGIASLDHPDRLLIALEPEAASIFCRKLRIRDCVIEDDLKAKAGDDSLISEDFEGVTQYIVVDCGGGTVDLTVHELDVTNGTLKELHKGTGGPSGATGVDREFESLLKRIFDPDFIERFKVKRPASWVDLMISFEAKKRTARPDNQSPLNVTLPFSFIDYHKKHRKCTVESAVKKFKNPDIKWSSQGMLRLSASVMKTLFEPIVSDVIGHIKTLLTKPTLEKVEYLFLVGGFAESPLLQHAIRNALQDRVRVIIPNDVGLAILKGAVLFGLDPTVIRIRRATLTYGVGVLNKFDPQKHDQSKRVVKDGIVWCKDIFDRFVSVDASVGIGDRVTRSYAPARAKQKSTVINIYCTEQSHVLYTTDKGVTRCGKLRMEMPDINPEDIPLEKRGKPRELQASMIFGDTEIKVSAVDVLSGLAARATVDFLNY